MRISLLRYNSLCCALLFYTSFASAGERIGIVGGTNDAPWSTAIVSSQVVHVDRVSIQIDFASGDLDLKHDVVVRWIEAAARAISVYYGKFPVARVRILVMPIAGERGVLSGTTWGNVDGFAAFTRMRLGQHTTEEDLTDDWTMTHEMVHIGFPSLSRNHHWLEEGLATYIEPIARAQTGTLSPERIWGDMMRDMPKGEPRPSDNGLDQTHTWASTYWGGALFCLMADIAIREQTGNRRGLQDALRAIVAAGGTINQEWPIARALAVGDHATGTSVLTELYGKMGMKPDRVDLGKLWKQLGVSSDEGHIVFDDHAPLAQVRHGIMDPCQWSPRVICPPPI
jgi:hypothetical protein